MLKKMNRNGVLALDTAKVVMLLFLVIAILGVVGIFVAGVLRTTTENTETKVSGSIINETVTIPTDAGQALSVSALRNVVCTITTVYNDSTGIILNSPNYSVSACVITNLSSEYIDADWNVTYSYTYNNPYANDIVSNYSSGVTSFFNNTGTIFSILIVVVIIAAISLIILYVRRFGGEAGGNI